MSGQNQQFDDSMIQQPKVNSSVPEQGANIKLISVLVGLLVVLGLGGLFYWKFGSLIMNLKKPLVSPLPSVISDPFANWKVYENALYQFQIKYPPDALLTEESVKEEYYDTILNLTTIEASASIRAISSIDIYLNSNPLDVAKREVTDVGVLYTVRDAPPSVYQTAVIELDTVPPKTIITIANPSKNEYIEIAYSGKPELLRGLLTTFKFITIVSPSPVVVNVNLSTPSTNIVDGWVTYNINDLLSAPTYRLPVGIQKPVFVNSNKTYQAVRLPGNSTLAIMPLGKNYENKLSQTQLLDKLQKSTNLTGLKVESGFGTKGGLNWTKVSGIINNPEASREMLILGSGNGAFNGWMTTFTNDETVLVLQYQDEFVIGPKNLIADTKLAEDILTTFKVPLTK